MSNMPAKITRLELVIIVAALVVLLFSNRPPQPGNAEIRTDTGLTAERPQDSAVQVQPGNVRSPDVANPRSIWADGPAVQSPAVPVPDNTAVEPVSQPQPKPKRIGMVDARNCDSLRYPNVMYGEITVRWVWDGTKFVPRKVCEVKESNGVVSVWSFDDRQEGVVLSELPQE